jgi:hypothetical protein
MNNRTLYRVRVEDLNDDVRNEVAELLRAGDSAKAIKQLDHFGFLEPSSVEADIAGLQKQLLDMIGKLPPKHLKGLEDGPASVIVHQGIPMNPAEASDHGLWVAIAIHGLRYVQSRWSDVPLHVFSGRSDHAWERLWWVGELLSVNGDYTASLEFSMNTNATNEVNRLFVRDKAWAIAFARIVGHYNPGGKAGPIPDVLINSLSKKVRILARTVPLPTPFSGPTIPGIVDEVVLAAQIDTALGLIRRQLEGTKLHESCGFEWPG